MHNQLLCYYSPTDTASYHVITILLTTLGYYSPTDTVSYHVNTPPLIQQATTVLYLNWYSKLLCSYNNLNIMIPDTAIPTTTIQQWFRKLPHYTILLDNNLLRYYTPIDTAIYYVNILLLLQQTITLLYSYWYSKLLVKYSYWYNKLIRHYTPITTAAYYVITLLLIQQAIMLIYSYWYNNLIRYYNSIDTAS